VKGRFNEFNEEADHLLKSGKKGYVYPDYPNATGSTQKPVAVFPEK
jgi:hydroxylamine dehydrogenase